MVQTGEDCSLNALKHGDLDWDGGINKEVKD